MEPKAQYGDAFALSTPYCATLHTGYVLLPILPRSTRLDLKIALLQWLSQREATRIAVRQRGHLAYMQKQLREQLGFSRS